MRREMWAPGLTRRSWLQKAACISSAAVLPQIVWAAAQDAVPGISPVMGKLSAYMAEARNRALPDNVVQETTHHILDTIAAMVSGSELPPGRMAIKFAQDYGGEKIATVVASQILCGPIEAAIANGMLAHSDETDDDFTTGGGHPGCAVVPAALASGERFGISGTHFLRAVAPPVLMPSRCAGCLIMPRSRLEPASARGGATPNISRRLSCSAPWGRATGSTLPWWFTPAGLASTIFSPALTISWSPSIPRPIRRGSSSNSAKTMG